MTNIYDLLCDMYNELKENILYYFNLYRNVEGNRPDIYTDRDTLTNIK